MDCHGTGNQGWGGDYRGCLTCNRSGEASYPANTLTEGLLARAVRHGPDLSNRPPCKGCGEDDPSNPCLARVTQCNDCDEWIHEPPRGEPCLCGKCEADHERRAYSGPCPGCGTYRPGSHAGCRDL